MDDSFYDTSWSLYSLQANANANNAASSTIPKLFSQPTNLHEIAANLRDHLSNISRPRYEYEEEREKIGNLRECDCRLIRQSQRQKQQHISDQTLSGLLVTLIYDKATYKFVIIVQNAEEQHHHQRQLQDLQSRKRKRTTEPENQQFLLLAKSTPSLLRRFTSFLTETYHIESIEPLRLPPSLLQRSLLSYLTTIIRETLPAHSNHAQLNTDLDEVVSPPAVNGNTNPVLLKTLKSTIGILKLTISFSNTATVKHNITPNLRNIDIDVPPETLAQLILQAHNNNTTTTAEARVPSGGDSVLDELAKHIHLRSGIKIPILRTSLKDAPVNANGTVNGTTQERQQRNQSGYNDEDYGHENGDVTGRDTQQSDEIDAEDAVMRISKISCSAFAIGCEGKVKFAAKALSTTLAQPDKEDTMGSDVREDAQDDLARIANEYVLLRILNEVMRKQ